MPPGSFFILGRSLWVLISMPFYGTLCQRGCCAKNESITKWLPWQPYRVSIKKFSEQFSRTSNSWIDWALCHLSRKILQQDQSMGVGNNGALWCFRDLPIYSQGWSPECQHKSFFFIEEPPLVSIGSPKELIVSEPYCSFHQELYLNLKYIIPFWICYLSPF